MRCRKAGRNSIAIGLLALAVSNFTPLPRGVAHEVAFRARPAPSVKSSPSNEAQAIETSTLASAESADSQRALLVKVETLLDRAHFSPGAIDGRPSANLHRALAAYTDVHGLATNGMLSTEVFNALTSADKAPVTQEYKITHRDERGPFIKFLPRDFTALARFKHLGYRGPEQELADRFHMSEGLLRSLNPNTDFSKAGTTVLVLRPSSGELGDRVARVEVDRSTSQVLVYNETGTVIGVFPATTGSTELSAPNSRRSVKSVTFNPDYVYDPRQPGSRKPTGKLTIWSGPNSPFGTAWIALTKETCGIHGSPDPSLVGKRASQGCVRLTNWDVTTLAHAVRKGTPVIFVGRTIRR